MQLSHKLKGQLSELPAAAISEDANLQEQTQHSRACYCHLHGSEFNELNSEWKDTCPRGHTETAMTHSYFGPKNNSTSNTQAQSVIAKGMTGLGTFGD
jgi:hypothetical protein